MPSLPPTPNNSHRRVARRSTQRRATVDPPGAGHQLGERSFDLDDAALGATFAGHASIARASAQTESGLREAIDGRHVIGLAQAILMERFDLSADQAFAVLRRYSQDRNTKLRAVACHVVQARTLPD